ncbi:urease subunit beta [Thermicanus aegyptius]|uniref:urease subunit beta n=1 Tax=Thermicanus aegyptius TaxID=94009 RepID=UPI0003F7E422|nr:urease subunit beta [Thermicanus aegyptius]
MKPGEILLRSEPIMINEGRESRILEVVNAGDRPIQVGSHFHFFEVNRYLQFDREKAFGYRLDIPSGTTIRFEPGERKEVPLTAFPKGGIVMGFNGLTDGEITEERKERAIANAMEKGFKGVNPA